MLFRSIKIIGSAGKDVFTAAETTGQETAEKDVGGIGNAGNDNGTDSLGSTGNDNSTDGLGNAGEPGRRPSGKAGISSLFPAILETMEALKEKLEALKQKIVAEF